MSEDGGRSSGDRQLWLESYGGRVGGYEPIHRRLCFISVLLSLSFGILSTWNLNAAEWVRPSITTNVPVWGIRGGLLFALPPGGFRGHEPRGLIRLGYPVLRGGGYDLINFIAVEPIVRGRRGFSELEKSELDRLPGKRLTAGTNITSSGLFAGTLSNSAARFEQLEVPVAVERFDNGAHVRLVLRQTSDAPDELALTVFAEADSAPIDHCILTATMGNMARTRLLWLKERVVSSKELYPDYKEAGFAPHRSFALDQLWVTEKGDLLVAVTNDEADPAAVYPFPNSEGWHYRGFKVTQYWKKPRGSFTNDLTAVVNGRFTYWQSRQPIPGGIAFENFELRERFLPGQTFILGITRRTPAALGFQPSTR